MKSIDFQSVDFSYDRPGFRAADAKVLDSITLNVDRGEFVTLLGRTCSGKSTLLKLCNGLILPTSGSVSINGMATHDSGRLWEIRRIAGMIFQNPDDQIIGATVAEDVAFGPENLGMVPQDIRSRVATALSAVDMTDLAESATHLLSNAQKLRVALAGILAMHPECILLDDAAALLEPIERREFMDFLHRYGRENGITVVHATRDREEAMASDRVIVLADGKIVFSGEPMLLGGEDSLSAEFFQELPEVGKQQSAEGVLSRC